jgi:quinol monooxygenase YgiN
MHSLTIVFEPLPGCEEALLAVCLEAAAPSRAEPGCLFFDVLVGTSPSGKREIVFYEAYIDRAAFDEHMRSPHTARWQAQALPLIERSSIRFPAHEGRS